MSHIILSRARVSVSSGCYVSGFLVVIQRRVSSAMKDSYDPAGTTAVIINCALLGSCAAVANSTSANAGLTAKGAFEARGDHISPTWCPTEARKNAICEAPMVNRISRARHSTLCGSVRFHGDPVIVRRAL